MAKHAPKHRGRIQAQGGGIEKSKHWEQDTPPTVSEILKMCDELEGMLSESERLARVKGFAEFREYVMRASKSGGIPADPRPHKKSFPRRGAGDIRVDLEIQKGLACIPDPVKRSEEGGSQ